MFINKARRGIALIELILFMIIVSVAIAGVVVVMSMTTKASGDPLLHKQALAIAESLLEEIELQDFSNSPCGVGCAGIVSKRNSFDDVFDYHGFAATADVVTGINALTSYSVSVTVAHPVAAWGSIAASDVAQISVIVSDASGQSIEALGYRTNY